MPLHPGYLSKASSVGGNDDDELFALASNRMFQSYGAQAPLRSSNAEWP